MKEVHPATLTKGDIGRFVKHKKGGVELIGQIHSWDCVFINVIFTHHYFDDSFTGHNFTACFPRHLIVINQPNFKKGSVKMIDIDELDPSDIGRWVKYRGFAHSEIGRIKSWNDRFIFVVYHCNEDWSNYDYYTGAATDPRDLEFIDPPEDIT